MSNRYDLDGMAAVVTGAAGGIGGEIARTLQRCGARLVLWDLDAAGLGRLGRELQAASVRDVDVADWRAVDAAMNQAVASVGRIDILINAAGINGPIAAADEHTTAEVMRVMAVNFVGTFNCSKAAVRHMRAAGDPPVRGRIVNIASIQGKEGMPRGAAYSASKAAVMTLAKSMARELALDGILVNSVAPAAVETAMAADLTPDRRWEILDRIPMGRFCEVGEVANMVAWLASPDATFTTGAVFDLSGGRATY